MDVKNVFQLDQFKGSSDFNDIETLVTKLSNNVHNLVMPYWVWLPEFDEASRRYFEAKKSKKRIPFKELVKRQDEFIKLLNKDLEALEKELKPFYQSESFAFKDNRIWNNKVNYRDNYFRYSHTYKGSYQRNQANGYYLESKLSKMSKIYYGNQRYAREKPYYHDKNNSFNAFYFRR